MFLDYRRPVVTIMYSKVNKKTTFFQVSCVSKHLNSITIFEITCKKIHTPLCKYTKQIWIICLSQHGICGENENKQQRTNNGFQQYDHAFSSRMSQGFVDKYIPKEKVKRLIR